MCSSDLQVRTGKHYTLPSEAQWEYACRAGTITPFHFGETLTSEVANYYGNTTYTSGPKGEFRLQTTPVGVFPANGWGLHEMHGNVWEWCADHWHDTYEGAPVDGKAWIDEVSQDRDRKADPDDQDKRRLLRGGSWNDLPRNCRSAFRDDRHPDYPGSHVGFRVCCLPQD